MGERWLVCGGRHFADPVLLNGALDGIVSAYGRPDCVIHGAARGADRLAAVWAIDKGIRCEPYPALWYQHGKAAGPLRNQQMIDDGRPTLVIAFPGGRGTADMTRRAEAAGIEILEILTHCSAIRRAALSPDSPR